MIAMPDPSKPSNSARATALLMRHHSQLYGFIYACLGNHADVEDVLQEVSLIVAQKFDQLENESGFLAWAREITRREILEFHKRHARRPAPFEPKIVQVLTDALQRLDGRTNWEPRHEALTECLDELPENSRKIIRMRYDSQIRNVESIAEQMGLTLSATYSVLKRIREGLRECVERRLAEENG